MYIQKLDSKKLPLTDVKKKQNKFNLIYWNCMHNYHSEASLINLKKKRTQ